MKNMKIILHNEYEIKMPDDYDYNEDDGEALRKQLQENITKNNELVEHHFWSNLELCCQKCGITLNLEEEMLDGICVQCNGGGGE